jgi:hypothetical protein
MKVLDLQCAQGHVFEGWFASEQDFVSQHERGMVQCPLCGDAAVHKKPSAPRLNLSPRRQEPSDSPINVVHQSAPDDGLTAAWLEMGRRILANTQDVGDRFAEEARKIHYGETDERAIRGQTTAEEARALVEEGIDILPVLLPQALKRPLQ